MFLYKNGLNDNIGMNIKQPNHQFLVLKINNINIVSLKLRRKKRKGTAQFLRGQYDKVHEYDIS